MDGAELSGENATGTASAARPAAQDDRFQITSRPLDLLLISALVSNRGTGALATFVGLVREHNAGRRVEWIDYEAHAALALKMFARIEGEAAARWPDAILSIHHRVGQVRVGEASVAIAAASPHRAEAFSVCRFAIERVKQMAPIWKHEHFEGGDVWVEGAIADPEDDEALRVAFERACS